LRKAKIDASAILFVLIFLLFAGGVVFLVLSFRSDPIRDSLTGDRVINTLFVIEHNDKPVSSYVLMYYPATGRAATVNIPGSLGLIIQSINRVDRIDTVYDPRRIGPFANEVGRLLGIEITFSIVITLENLGKITDLITGVEIFIPSPVSDYQSGYIIFPSGVNILDGDKAKTYITYELPDESNEIINFRRQRFFVEFIKRLGEQNHFLNNPRAAQIFHSLLKTGINQKTQTNLFNEFAKIDTGRMGIQSVGGNVREVSGQPLIFPHFDGSLIKEIVRQTLASLVRPTEGLLGDRIFTVEVQNGTTVTGLAGRTAELIRGFGYDVVSTGNADRNDYERTLIIDRSGYQHVARTFADVIRCTNIRFDSPEPDETEVDIRNFEYRADFVLIIGRDFNGRFVAN